MAVTDNILWKPRSERDGNLVVLFPYRAGNVVIRDSNGNIIARGTSTGPSNGFQDTIRFDVPGSRLQNVTVEDDTGRTFNIGDGSRRYENIGAGSSAEDTEMDTPEGQDDDLPDTPGGDLPPDPALLDPSIITTPDPIAFPTIPPANFNFTDPIDTARRVGDFNREQSERNFVTAVERSRELSQEELESIQEFAAGMSDFQLELLDTENLFNAQQRLRSADIAIPGVQDVFARQRERAETLAEGRLLETAEDRAFELTARNAAAEGAAIRGFGDQSVVARRQSDLLSAEQRLGVQQLGEGFLNRSLQQASTILMDIPTKANIAQRLPAQPAVPLTQLAPALQAQENALTTFRPEAAQQSIVGQEQFQTQIEQRRNEFNATGQFQADRFNSEQMFAAILSRANIQAANVRAVNEAGTNRFNVEQGNRIRSEFGERLDQAVADFRQNRDRNQLLQTLGSIYGGIRNVPDGVIDFIERQTGLDLGGNTTRPVPESTQATDRTPPDLNTSEPERAVPGDTEDTQTEVPISGTGSPDVTPETTVAPDRQEPDLQLPEPERAVPETKMFSPTEFRQVLRRSGFTKRQINVAMRRIESQTRFNSGASLLFNIQDDDEFVGVI